ncbi:unnamed protein product [Rotaria sp. Silwood1]|nr:unnamed protein product [Rotaria sp. Silwood1]
MLRPELIVPPIVEKLFASIDNTNEPHRFTSIMTCLTRITRQLVRQTSCYSQGQTYVLPLITSVLPGIDLNDFKKTLVTLEFLDTIFMLITCVDCSSAIHIRNDLTEMIREKITDFLTHACWPSKVRKLVTGLVRAIVMGDSVETLKYLLPKTCESINKIINDSEGNVLLNDHKGDKELTWYLVLFSELVRARGDTLMIYKETIISVFHRCIQIIHKGSYKAIASAAKHILKSLTHVYIIDTRLAIENIDESFIDFLPIRAWGQPTNVDQVQVQYHIPNDDELDFVREFVETFMSWRQQEMAMSFLCLLLQKHVPIPSSCIHTFVDLLVHDNIELRKYAVKSIAAICRLQKPPRIYAEKSIDEVLHEHNNGSSTVIIRDECNPGDRDDNLWITIDGYKPPNTQAEWEQMCFLDKTFHGYYTWPKMIKYPMNKRARYTQNDMPEQVTIIYNRFIDKNFVIQSTNLMVSDENTDEINFNYVRYTMFKSLFRNFGHAFVDNFMEQLYVLIHEKIQEKQEDSHRVAAEIVAGMIRGSKYWTLEMEHGDPRRMYQLIDFIRTLINNQINSNTFTETSRWSLIQTLKMFQWRIPSIWCTIHEHAKELLDYSFKPVREHIAK